MNTTRCLLLFQVWGSENESYRITNNETERHLIPVFGKSICQITLLVFYPSTAEKIFGISQEQFLKKPYLWHQLVHPDDLQNVKKNQENYIAGYRLT